MELIDPNGELWDGVSEQLRHRLGAAISGPELAGYLVRNLGWVIVRSKGDVCELKCRPSMMTDATLAALLYKIHDARRGTAFAIDFGLQDGVTQVIRDVTVATTVLSSLVGNSSRTETLWRGERFLSRTLSEEDTPFNATSDQLRTILDGASNFKRAADRVSQLINTRWSLSSLSENDGDWVELFNSGGFTPFNPAYPKRQHGSRLSDYASDVEYIRWVSQCRRQVLEQGRSDLSAVDAIVHFDRVGEARLRYNRLCIPIRYNGRNAVLMAAQTDPSIDLRQ